MKIIIYVYTLAMMGYTAFRTYDFIKLQLPAGEFSWFFAIVFLFGTEIGLIIWHLAIDRSTSRVQYYIAWTFTIVNFFGSLGAGIADMIIRQTLVSYEIPASFATALIYGMPLLIAVNIAAGLVFHLYDGETMVERERRFLEYEATLQATRDVSKSRRNLVIARKREIYNDMVHGYRAPTLDGANEPPALPAGNTGKSAGNTGKSKTRRRSANGKESETVNFP